MGRRAPRSQSQATGLLQSWHDGGPKLLWTFKDAGMGYSSMAVTKASSTRWGPRLAGTITHSVWDAATGKETVARRLGRRLGSDAYASGGELVAQYAHRTGRSR